MKTKNFSASFPVTESISMYVSRDVNLTIENKIATVFGYEEKVKEFLKEYYLLHLFDWEYPDYEEKDTLYFVKISDNFWKCL